MMRLTSIACGIRMRRIVCSLKLRRGIGDKLEPSAQVALTTSRTRSLEDYKRRLMPRDHRKTHFRGRIRRTSRCAEGSFRVCSEASCCGPRLTHTRPRRHSVKFRRRVVVPRCRSLGEFVYEEPLRGNMSFQTTKATFARRLSRSVQVTRVHMVMDRETGKARGFAFVEMPNDEEAAKAIAGLDGKDVGGRNWKVNEARPKERGGPPKRWRRAGWRRGGRGGSGGGGGRSRRQWISQTRIIVKPRGSHANRAGNSS